VAAPPLDSPCDGLVTYPGDTKILVKSSKEKVDQHSVLTYLVFIYCFYFVIIETINAECKSHTCLGTQLAFSDLNPKAPECISMPVMNGLTTEYTYFEYHGGSSGVYNLHANSN